MKKLEFKIIKNILIAAFLVFSILTTFFNFSTLNSPKIFPKLNFGIDVKGGHELTLKLDFEQFFKEKKDFLVDQIDEILWQYNIRNVEKTNLPENFLLTFKSKEDLQKFEENFSNKEFKLNKKANSLEFELRDKNEIKSELIKNIIPILSKRTDSLGLKEITFMKYSNEKIKILLHKDINLARIKNLITKNAALTFHRSPEKTDKTTDIEFFEFKNLHGKKFPLIKKPLMTGVAIKDARPFSEGPGNTGIYFQLQPKYKEIFAEITRKNINKPLVIVIDNEIISAPVVNSPITSGSGTITGKFTDEELMELAILLKSGASEAKIRIVEEKDILQTISNSMRNGILKSFIVSFIFISILMIYRYKKLGTVSIFSLLINFCLIVTLSSLLSITITIPALVSIILTLGISIDANILIFEKVRELKVSSIDRSIIEKSFEEAENTIFDSNITTVFAALGLFISGFGFLKNFGIVLILGIMCSVFTSVYLTKRIILLMLKKRLIN